MRGASHGPHNLHSKSRGQRHRYIASGPSFFFSLPGMNGLHGCARIGADVFQTTLNWPSAFTSPIITGLCRWWFLASIVITNPSGDLNVWPPIAAITLLV